MDEVDPAEQVMAEVVPAVQGMPRWIRLCR